MSGKRAEAAVEAGFPCWRARLELEFARRDARSVLARRAHDGPLVVQKALHPEGDAVCHAVVVHPPGGVASGDRLEIDVTVAAGAHALLTTPGATKWYRSRGGAAGSEGEVERSRQALVARVAAGATLEWLPQENIVFDAARAELDTRLELARGARMVGWEIVCLGRSASGERFTRGELAQRTELFIDGRLVWRERGTLDGGGDLLRSPVGLDGKTVYGTLWLAGLAPERALLERLRAVAVAGVVCGVTALPEVTLARALADDGEALRACFAALWREARPGWLGREAIPPRIWAT
ncbi:MAG: urease accessory protein UreD [Azoarcus sp.]|jgi:urease accessory protein|nr:urease accessory protein UreD [Azoarcus sp.]